MKKPYLYSFEKHLKEELKDPGFKKIWEESEAEYRLACKLIETRMKKKMSQRALAAKVKTTQKVISNIETMDANPSLHLLKRIAKALDTKLQLNFK